MSLTRKLIAGSALVLAGCSDPVFEGTLGKESVKLEASQIPEAHRYKSLTVTGKEGCDYNIKTEGDKVYFLMKQCGDSKLETTDPRLFGNAQEVYDSYMQKIKDYSKK